MFKRHRYLVLRRLSQTVVIVAFVSGPWFGWWIAQGSLASSRWLEQLTLVDPFVLAQSGLAGLHFPLAGIAGAVLVALFYALVGGRVFCGWVCPINLVSDAANGLRRFLGWPRAAYLRPDRRLRIVLLVFILVASALSGVVVWEVVNPINMVMRGLVFGLWTGLFVAVAAIFLLDFFVLSNGWCGYICPVGAFYGALGKASLLTVSAVKPQSCTRCGDCFTYCPEPQVISPVLRGKAVSPIRDVDCLRCGRCIDVCDEGVFAYTLRGPSSWQVSLDQRAAK